MEGKRGLSHEDSSGGGGDDGSHVNLTVPTFLQTYSWDCGLACASMVLRYLGHDAFTVYTTDLEALKCGESIWTVDLAALMRRYNIHHKLCTITMGVDKGYSKQAFYSGKFSTDEQRVSDMFENATSLGLNIEQRSVLREDFFTHLQGGNLFIVLVDWNHLECLWCDRLRCQTGCFPCVSNRCCGGYQGHYIVVCGFDKKKKRIFYKNPSYDEDLCCSRFDKFDLARKSYGTDEDVLYIYKNNS